MNLLGEYQNGNYITKIYDDGTKIRENELDFFEASFPENMDVKITNYCDMNCPMCHEDSSIKGKHGDILQADFIDTLVPYTEMAIGGGNPISHPDIIPFLKKLKEKRIIANITVNQKHFMDKFFDIQDLSDRGLVYGIGVSLTDAHQKHFISSLQNIPNTVLHVINGIVSEDDLTVLSGHSLKMLILGYKQFRRGIDYYSDQVQRNMNWLHDNIQNYLDKFKVVSFDNLAIEQLELQRHLSENVWNEFYMGDDGKFTMYVDLVERKFARCSVAEIRHNLMDNVVDMFEVIKNEPV